MVQLASNEEVAQQATTGIAQTRKAQRVATTISQSTIKGMKNGAAVSNEIVDTVNTFVEAIQDQAKKFPELAKVIAVRDKQAAAAVQNSRNKGGAGF